MIHGAPPYNGLMSILNCDANTIDTHGFNRGLLRYNLILASTACNARHRCSLTAFSMVLLTIPTKV